MDNVAELYKVLIDIAISDGDISTLIKLYTSSEQNRQAINSSLKQIASVLKVSGEWQTLPDLIQEYDRETISKLPSDEAIKYAINIRSVELLMDLIQDNNFIDMGPGRLIDILCHAIKSGSEKVVELLLAGGKVLNAINYNGSTIINNKAEKGEWPIQARKFINCAATNAEYRMIKHIGNFISDDFWFGWGKFFGSLASDYVKNFQNQSIKNLSKIVYYVILSIITRSKYLQYDGVISKSGIIDALHESIISKNREALNIIIDMLVNMYEYLDIKLPFSTISDLMGKPATVDLQEVCRFFNSIKYMYGGGSNLLDNLEFRSLNHKTDIIKCVMGNKANAYINSMRRNTQSLNRSFKSSGSPIGQTISPIIHADFDAIM